MKMKMNFMTKPLFEYVMEQFRRIDMTIPTNGDGFFDTFGPGNTLDKTDRPFERFSDYETLLIELQKQDSNKYDAIHKGTPFYFLAWLAFDLRNYEKALFYLDAAISEDIRRDRHKWNNRPAAQFLMLNTQSCHVATRTTKEITIILNEYIGKFNKISGLQGINQNQFITCFVQELMKSPETRTIISAFYVFLLEIEERSSELRLRSTEGSSLGPIITHLFSGGLIFESLLKYIYTKSGDTSAPKTLSKLFQKSDEFKSDFNFTVHVSADNLEKIRDEAVDDNIATTFSTASMLRNTTGHNLIWDNVFNDPSTYEKLVGHIIYALLYLIEKKFIRVNNINNTKP